MKFLCLKCDEAMTIKRVEGSEDNSITITYICQGCGYSFAMLTNPMESQLVKGLGVHIGGRKVVHKHMEVISETLMKAKEEGNNYNLLWDKEAEARLLNIPVFVRPMAKAGIERYAKEKGHKNITLEVMDEARKVYGM